MVGIRLTLNDPSATAGDGQRDTVQRDRSLLDHVASHGVGQREANNIPVFTRSAFDDRGRRVDVTLHEVPAQPARQGQRAFEVHRRNQRPATPRLVRRSVSCHHVGGELAVDHLGHRQADAVDSDRVAEAGVGRDEWPAKAQGRRFGASIELDDASKLFDDSGEHQ